MLGKFSAMGLYRGPLFAFCSEADPKLPRLDWNHSVAQADLELEITFIYLFIF